MFHTLPLPRRPAVRYTSVPLSRTRLPRFVLQEARCSVHARAGFPPASQRLPRVKVKLTIALPVRAGAASIRPIHPHRFFPGAGRGGHTGLVQTGWSSRGKGWGCHPDSPARQDPDRRGRAFSEPCLFVGALCWPRSATGLPHAARRPSRKYEPDRPIHPRSAAFPSQGRWSFKHPHRLVRGLRLDTLLEPEFR